MATKLYINYLRKSDISGIDEIKRIHLSHDKNIRIREDDSFHGIVVSKTYDFRNAAETQGSISSPNGYSDNVYRYMVEADGTLHAWICCAVPLDTALPSPDYQEVEHTGAATIFLAQGEADSVVGGGSSPHWIPGALTESEKKTRAIDAIKAWREQKKTWLLESPEYADLMPNITLHLGYWLRSADYVIWYEFDKKKRAEAGETVTGALDWLIIEAIAKEAAKGPRTLDPDGDGAYNVAFFQAFKALVEGSAGTPFPTAGFPNGPDFGALWVQTWDLTQVSDVVRTASLSVVIATHYQPLATDRTYSGLSASYNPTAEYWTS